jgi:hypothetical protein
MVSDGRAATTRFRFDLLDFKQAPAWNGTYNLTTTLSPTLTNEFVFGASQNNLTLDPTNANAGTYSGFGFKWATPFPYPASQFINIAFGNGYIAGHNWAGTASYSQFPYKNSNTTFDFYDNMSKVSGAHTIKGGIYVQRSRKDQAAGNSMSIVFNPLNNPGGTANLANTNNTGHAYADALAWSLQHAQSADARESIRGSIVQPTSSGTSRTTGRSIDG